MLVKFKRHHKDAVIPKYSKPGDNGLDLTSISYNYVDDSICPYHNYEFGLSVEIPIGYVGFLLPRSSNSKTDLILANSTGIIDTNYRGTLSARFKEVFRPNSTTSPKIFNVGDRVVQLIILPLPQIIPVEVTELSDTVRGTQGWGSSGS